MSTVTATQSASESIAVPGVFGGRNHFLIRRLHSLTGIVFGGYIIVHLLVNATLVQGVGRAGGPTIYQLQVDKIHSLPLLMLVEWLFIYIPIIYHTVYGLVITFTGEPNAFSYPYGKNWFYVFQRISALILVFFILFHILSMKGVFGGRLGQQLTFNPFDATATVATHMHAAWWIPYIIYPIGILASCYHLANGFWTAAITWGLTISKASQRRWGFCCGGLFLFTAACGLVALIAAVNSPMSGPGPILK